MILLEKIDILVTLDITNINWKNCNYIMKYVFFKMLMAKVIKLYQFSKNEFFNRYCFFLNIIELSQISYIFLELLEFFQQITKRIFETI